MSKRNSYSAKHLSVAAKHVCSSGLRYYGGWTAILPPWGWSAGTHVCPSTSSAQDRQPRIHYHLIHYSFFFFFFLVYTKHTAEYILISQELYWCSRHFTMNPREPAFSGRMGCLYKPSGVFHFKKPSSPFTAALGSAPAQIIPPLFLTGSAHRYTWPTMASHSGRQSQCQFCITRGQRHRLSDPAKDLGNSKTISPSTLKIKYTSADACPEIV